MPGPAAECPVSSRMTPSSNSLRPEPTANGKPKRYANPAATRDHREIESIITASKSTAPVMLFARSEITANGKLTMRPVASMYQARTG